MDPLEDYSIGIAELDQDPLCKFISWYQSVPKNRIVLKPSKDTDYCLCKRTDGTWDKVEDNIALSKFISAHIPLAMKYVMEQKTVENMSQVQQNSLELLSNILLNITDNNQIQIAITYQQVKKLLYHITMKYKPCLSEESIV